MIEDHDASAIGPRIRAARERRGYSREELGYRSGLSWGAIEQIESGRRRQVRPDTLLRLCDALELTTDYVLSGRSRPPAMLEHRALIYRDEADFATAAGAFVAEGIAASQAVFAVTTETKLDLLRDHVGKDASKATFIESQGWLRTPASTVVAFRGFIDDATDGGAGWVGILCELIWLGRSEADVMMWTEFEAMVNVTFAPYPVSLLCSYDERLLPKEVVTAARVTHPAVVERGRSADSEHYIEPKEFLLGPDRP